MALWFVGADASKYLVLSVPKDRVIGYYLVPSTIFRVLIQGGDEGPATPKSIAIDQEHARLFCADQPTQKIYWYQLIVLPDGKLVTDGRQHVAVESVEANWLAVDGVGNLFFSGKIMVPPPLQPIEGIFKHDTIQLATAETINSAQVWNKANSGSPNPRAYAPAGLATDNFHLFWANSADGKTYGSLIKAPVTPPDVSPELSVNPMADNADNVRAVVLTPTSVFYTTSDGIYGVSKGKAGAACTADTCKKLSDSLAHPMGLVWDGDGTVYVAEHDIATGAIYSFPANGPLGQHKLEKYVDMPGVYGLEMLEVPSSTVGHSFKMVYAVLLFALARYFH